MISHAGAALPKELIQAGEGNTAGHWESQRLANMHDAFLARLGQSWDAMSPVKYGEADAQWYGEQIAEIIADDFDDQPLIVIKEPRTARFARLTIESLEELGFNVHVVHALRNPLEVAQSLKTRNGIPLNVGALQWLRHVIDIELSTYSRPHFIIEYAQLMARGTQVVREMFAYFGLANPGERFETDAEGFLNPDLRHHVEPDWTDHDELRDWVGRSYELIRSDAPQPPTRDTLTDLRRIDTSFRDATDVLNAVRSELSDDYENLQQRLGAELAETIRQHDETIVGLTRDIETLRAAREQDAAFARVARGQSETVIEQAKTAIEQVKAARDEKEAAARQAKAALAQQVQAGEALSREIEGVRAQSEARLAQDTERFEATLSKRDAVIAARDKTLEAQIKTLAAREAKIASLGETLAAATAAHEKLSADLQSKTRKARRLDRKLKTTQVEASETAAELSTQRASVQSLSEGMVSLHREVAEQASRADALEDRLRAVRKAARARQLADAERSKRDADRLAELTRTLDFEAKHSKSRELQLNALRDSTSWRMTRPLRRIINLWRNRSRVMFALVGGKDFREIARNEDIQANLESSRSPSVLEARRKLSASAPTVLESGFMRSTLGPRLRDKELPNVTISAVTWNSEGWLWNFFVSLESLDYPMNKISVHFVDNGSSDGTITGIESFIAKNAYRYRNLKLSQRPNLGYGTGNDWAIRDSEDDFVLVTNVDIEFYRSSLREAVRVAVADDPDIACWEFRQAPYEHPKYYDPVTLLTNWNAHACVLLRRSAYLDVGGYDKTIFMYGEDVELSYRFLSKGYRLRYVPRAAIIHHVDLEDLSKRPNQLSGSTAANVLMRYRYGELRDIGAGEALLKSVHRREVDPVRVAAFAKVNEIVRENRKHFWRNRVPQAQREKYGAAFPFNEFDYDIGRPGGDVVRPPFRKAEHRRLPLISIVTRTHGPSDIHLRNAMACVLNQTYPNIEHIIVEDKTDDGRDIVERTAEVYGRDRIRYFKSPGRGRSECGNYGASKARGEYICWLDNDDLLFADHIETLVRALDINPDAVASYALAWDAYSHAQEDGEQQITRFELPAVHNRPYDRERLLTENFIPIQSIIFRRDLFTRFGGFNPDFWQLEDWNLWARYSRAGDFVYTPKVTSIYRTPEDPEVRQKRHLLLNDYYEDVRQTNLEDIAAIDRLVAKDEVRSSVDDELELWDIQGEGST